MQSGQNWEVHMAFLINYKIQGHHILIIYKDVQNCQYRMCY